MGRFRNRGISDLKEKGNAECAVQWSVAGMIIMQLPVGLKSMGLPKTGGVFLRHFHNHHAILANGH